MQHAAKPDYELNSQRPIQTEALADLLDLVSGCAVARDDCSRISRRQVQQQEDDHRNDEEHGGCAEQALQKESKQRHSLSTFHIAKAPEPNPTMPLIELRAAIGLINSPSGT